MDRTERLLDLVALLLDSREPISWSELRESFPDDYAGGSDEAAERKFERDKAELLELGIPIRYVQGDDERRDGYIVDRESYYLPHVALTPEELAVLYAAGSAALASGAFPGSSDLAHALRKVGFIAGIERELPNVRLEIGAEGASASLMAERLEQLWAAAGARKWVEISYFSPRKAELTERRVDPYGLALRQGVWSLVGYCHLRKDIRTFSIHRIRDLKVNSAKPRSPDFEVPADFVLEKYVANHPWEHRFHAEMAVQVRLTGELAPLGEKLFPPGTIERQDRQETLLTVKTTFLDGLAQSVLALGAECKIVAPPQAVARWRELAGQVLARHSSNKNLASRVTGHA